MISALKNITKPVAKLGKSINDSMLGDLFIEVAKVMFVGVILGLMAAVAVITFTLIMMVIIG